MRAMRSLIWRCSQPISITTRIKTPTAGRLGWTNIPTLNPYPLQQGLRQCTSALPVAKISALNPYPLQQGLRLYHSKLSLASGWALNPYPLQQGLRLVKATPPAQTMRSQPISITTRIKTVDAVSTPVLLNALSTHIHYNKD